MRRDLVSGTLLIVGSLAGIAIAALHPTGHDILTAQNLQGQVQLGVMVHAAALVAVPILFLGLLGFSRFLGSSDLTTAALVAYGFGGVATISAAVASGLVATALFERIRAAQGPGVYDALAWYTHLINQGFAKVHLVA